ncbi:undecaprenyl-diphosphate phosphatase [Cryobacterium arcticum]|uniref:undecaprenyl-diphosphate phosphatase n=1 Tax=Cryobacterium arcticum TaxID=670052 RepID=UPI00082A2E3E|nr:undecaprenyl-diphosphate phosphatase [Cryobacterium arcticum]
MDTVNAIILGIVQGLTEFIPVSSSAHIRIVGSLLGTGADPGAAFTAITQLGTEAAVLLYFWRDIARIISRWFLSLTKRVPRSDPDARLGWFIILGSVPIVILGVALQTLIESTFRSLWIVAVTLIVFGVVLGVADAIGAKRRRLADLTVGDAAIFGGAQALALIPGVSRSGGTITAGLLMGYERTAAARYSFLLAIPAVFGSGLYELYKTVRTSCGNVSGACTPEVFTGAQTALATGIAFVVGLAVISLLMRYLATRSFLPFVIYRIALGVGLIVALTTGALTP